MLGGWNVKVQGDSMDERGTGSRRRMEGKTGSRWKKGEQKGTASIGRAPALQEDFEMSG
jgi:hypothetical protein